MREIRAIRMQYDQQRRHRPKIKTRHATKPCSASINNPASPADKSITVAISITTVGQYSSDGPYTVRNPDFLSPLNMPLRDDDDDENAYFTVR